MKLLKPSNRLILLQNLSDRLVWLEVKKDTDKLRIIGGGVEPFFTLEDGDEIQLPADTPLDRLKTAIEAVYQRTHAGWLTQQEVIYVVPSHRLTARFLETPPTSEDNIRDLVAFEVSEALQVPIEGIAWDMILSSDHGNSEEKHLLWIATRREYIEGVIGAWPDNTLVPTQLTADFWAYYEFLLHIGPHNLQEPTILITQEGNRATISVANRRSIYFTRSVTLARTVLISEEANPESLKERQLAMEIQRTLAYVSDRFPAGTLKEMIVCGFENWDQSQLEGIADQYNCTVTRLTLEDVNDFLSGDLSHLQPEHLSLICMAYCHIQQMIAGPSLLEEKEEKTDWQSLIPHAVLPSNKFILTAGSLFAALAVIVLFQYLWYSHAVSSRMQQGNTLLKLADRLKSEETGLRACIQTNVNYADLFLFLAETLPEGVLVKTISIDLKNGVDLVLVGGNHQMVTDVIDKFNGSPYFREFTETRAVNEQEGFTVYLRGKLKA